MSMVRGDLMRRWTKNNLARPISLSRRISSLDNEKKAVSAPENIADKTSKRINKRNRTPISIVILLRVGRGNTIAQGMSNHLFNVLNQNKIDLLTNVDI